MPPFPSTPSKILGTWNKGLGYPRKTFSFPVDLEDTSSSPLYDEGYPFSDDEQVLGPTNLIPPHTHVELLPETTTESPHPAVIVRGEEIGIVIVVLLLWVGAIALFFNRWGKIRMLEPYQPKFCESHRPSCPIADVPPISHFPRTLSKFNLSSEGSPHFAKCTYNNYNYPVSTGGVMAVGYGGGGGTSATSAMTSTSSPFPSTSSANPPPTPHHRPNFPPQPPLTNPQQQLQRLRQNSVFSPFIPLNCYVKHTSRKTKSAVDLSNLIFSEEFIENVRRNSKNSITNV